MDVRNRKTGNKWKDLISDTESDAESDAEYEEPEKIDTRPELVKHIEAFAGVEPDQPISVTSLYNQSRKLGDDILEATKQATGVSFVGGIVTNRCPFSLFTANQVGPGLMHGYATGIYNKDMTFNENVWKELQNYFKDEEIEGVNRNIITETSFYQFLAVRRIETATGSLLQKHTSDGEWSKFWLQYSKNLPNGDKYVLSEDLRLFFEDSRRFIKKYQAEKVETEVPRENTALRKRF